MSDSGIERSLWHPVQNEIAYEKDMPDGDRLQVKFDADSGKWLWMHHSEVRRGKFLKGVTLGKGIADTPEAAIAAAEAAYRDHIRPEAALAAAIAKANSDTDTADQTIH